MTFAKIDFCRFQIISTQTVVFRFLVRGSWWPTTIWNCSIVYVRNYVRHHVHLSCLSVTFQLHWSHRVLVSNSSIWAMSRQCWAFMFLEIWCSFSKNKSGSFLFIFIEDWVMFFLIGCFDYVWDWKSQYFPVTDDWDHLVSKLITFWYFQIKRKIVMFNGLLRLNDQKHWLSQLLHLKISRNFNTMIIFIWHTRNFFIIIIRSFDQELRTNFNIYFTWISFQIYLCTIACQLLLGNVGFNFLYSSRISISLNGNIWYDSFQESLKIATTLFLNIWSHRRILYDWSWSHWKQELQDDGSVSSFVTIIMTLFIFEINTITDNSLRSFLPSEKLLDIKVHWGGLGFSLHK